MFILINYQLLLFYYVETWVRRITWSISRGAKINRPSSSWTWYGAHIPGGQLLSRYWSAIIEPGTQSRTGCGPIRQSTRVPTSKRNGGCFGHSASLPSDHNWIVSVS